MFCTGDAPTVPGISARFSSPSQPCSTQVDTKPCQFSPPAASTSQASGRASSSRTPWKRTRATSPGTVSGSTTLLPPPSTSSGAPAKADKAGNCDG